MMPVLEREIIAKKGWVTIEEVMDYYTLAQVTPGVIAVNVSTFIGYKRCGIGGGIVSTLSFVLPGVALVTLAALCLSRFSSLLAVKYAFDGIRVAVGALILDTTVKLCKGLFKDGKAVVFFLITFALSAFLSSSPVLLLIAAGFGGFFLYGPKK